MKIERLTSAAARHAMALTLFAAFAVAALVAACGGDNPPPQDPSSTTSVPDADAGTTQTPAK
jgi:hypothetical protein